MQLLPVIILLLCFSSAFAQESLPSKFAFPSSSIEISRRARPNVHFDAIGRKSAILGVESGVFESWVFPMKLFHDARISISVEGQDNAVDFSSNVEQIVARPESTTLVCSDQRFTIRATFFSPIDEPGSIILLDIDATKPLTITVSFVPDLKPMWPGGLGGQTAGWSDERKAFVISESRRKFNGLFGSPAATRGISTPAHQLASGALRFDLKIDPQVSKRSFYPLIIAGGVDGRQPVIDAYNRLSNSIQEQYLKTFNHYRRLRDEMMRIETPENELNLAFEWAKASMDKGMIANPELGYGLVAGWGASGKGARPGFGWFFGGDASINSYAVAGYGDFDSAAAAFRFLAKFQRADGKIPHEVSQSAAMIKWFDEYPYAYYHAETTPFFIAAVFNLYRHSGERKLIEELWPSLRKAYQFCLDNDTDGDGILENWKAGLGASELGTLLDDLHQDIYLAATNLEASLAMRELAGMMGDQALRDLADQKYQRSFAAINELYWNQNEGRYIYALTRKMQQNLEMTAWTAVPMMFGQLDARRAKETVAMLGSSQLSSDWGVRMLSNRSPHYDPIGYNNGGVWPFLTGFAAAAEYEYRNPYSGLAHIRQIARLTFDNAAGAHTEILSGDYYRPLDESVPRQLFSSGMAVTPFVRGMMGLRPDAPSRTLRVAPQIPPAWEKLKISNFRIGRNKLNIDYKRLSPSAVRFEFTKNDDDPLKLQFAPALPKFSKLARALIDGKAIKLNPNLLGPDFVFKYETTMRSRLVIDIVWRGGIEFDFPFAPARPGDRTASLKILDLAVPAQNRLSLTLEGLSGRSYIFRARAPQPILEITGAVQKGDDNGWKLIELNFPPTDPPGTYQIRKVELRLKEAGKR